MIEQLIAFQQDIYDTNVSKGFWIEGRSKGEAVALICSELYEAVEAHRKSKRAQIDQYKFELKDTEEDFGLAPFAVFIKDTVEDEIADAVIRILDCSKGWDWDLTFGAEFGKPSTGNFAHDILRINWYIINAYHKSPASVTGFPKQNWYYVMCAIEVFCSWYQIDLVQHVEWKLRYNKTREHLHGKKY